MPYGQNERQNILQQTSMRHQYVALKNRLVRCNANSKKKNGVPQQKKGFLGRNSTNIPGSQVLFRSQNQFYEAIKLEKKNKVQLTKKASRTISQTNYDILAPDPPNLPYSLDSQEAPYSPESQQIHQNHHIHHIKYDGCSIRHCNWHSLLID